MIVGISGGWKTHGDCPWDATWTKRSSYYFLGVDTPATHAVQYFKLFSIKAMIFLSIQNALEYCNDRGGWLGSLKTEWRTDRTVEFSSSFSDPLAWVDVDNQDLVQCQGIRPCQFADETGGY